MLRTIAQKLYTCVDRTDGSHTLACALTSRAVALWRRLRPSAAERPILFNPHTDWSDGQRTAVGFLTGRQGPPLLVTTAVYAGQPATLVAMYLPKGTVADLDSGGLVPLAVLLTRDNGHLLRVSGLAPSALGQSPDGTVHTEPLVASTSEPSTGLYL